ncbi:MAG: VacJ family lipoprotein [SAR324 cluster bacterium]|nr:VacJ family lipoprotein [SAR324 cluster bacterium]
MAPDAVESEDSMDDMGGFDEFDDEFGSEAKPEVFDPLSGYNRVMTGFNDWFYTWVLDPVARGYRWVMPEFARRGIVHFFHNILFPVRFVNNALQLKFQNAGEEFARFGLNSTIGILGFWDPAQEWFGLEPHEEDFGQTLGYYGVGSGFHIVLPFMGPSNLRDSLSLFPDFYLDPVSYAESPYDNVENYPYQLGIRSFDIVNETSLHIGEYENLKKDAIELYPFLREVYEQNRAKKIEE